MAKPGKSINSFYYPSLDGLRFFAFFLVFLHHSLFNLSSNNQVINFFLVIIEKNGWVGVDLFFVLSGFLITSLLIRERRVYGRYSLKNFWIRRSLRIWPLYYLALIMGFFVIPYFYSLLGWQNFSDPKYNLQRISQLPLYLTFLGNWSVVFSSYSAFANISHLWTISLEEQFYLVWPLVLLFIINFRRTLLAGMGILMMSIGTRLFMALNMAKHPAVYTNTLARMDTLALGAILALIFFYKPEYLRKLSWLTNPVALVSSLIIFLLFLHRIFVFNPRPLQNIIFGYPIIGLFMVYFVFTSLNPNILFTKILSFPLFVWLGKISYGLYVWHLLALDLGNRFLTNCPLAIKVFVSLLITITISTISYYLFEAKFLRLKQLFTKIASRSV